MPAVAIILLILPYIDGMMRQLQSCFFLPVVWLTSACSEAPSHGTRCLGTLPDDAELSVLGAYTGETISVVSNSWFTNKQVIAVSSHDKVTWDFSKFPADKLLGVIASGETQPTVIGVPENVPVQMLWDAKSDPKRPCGLPFHVYRSGVEADYVIQDLNSALNLPVTRFRGAYSATEIDAGATDQQEAVVERSEPKHRDDYPGVERLTPLIASGQIRQATQDDIDAYNDRATAALLSGKFQKYAAENLTLPTAYVVLKPMSLPDNMPWSRSFIVEADVPVPFHRNGGNNFYFLDSGKCTEPDSMCPGQPTSKMSLSELEEARHRSSSSSSQSSGFDEGGSADAPMDDAVGTDPTPETYEE